MGLETVAIIMAVEDHFGAGVPDEVASNCVTVADLQRVLVDSLVRKGRARSADLEDEVYRDLVKIIVDQTGLKASDVRPESKWVGDITYYG
jgi:acyl carrier protein